MCVRERVKVCVCMYGGSVRERYRTEVASESNVHFVVGLISCETPLNEHGYMMSYENWQSTHMHTHTHRTTIAPQAARGSRKTDS